MINKGGITYKGTPWHRDCFTCTNCQKILAGEKFTSREDQPYCAECFGELFAKKCIKCAKPITGKPLKKLENHALVPNDFKTALFCLFLYHLLIYYSSSSLGTFRSKLKSYLLSKAYPPMLWSKIGVQG